MVRPLDRVIKPAANVREFSKSDFGRVAELHRRTFRTGDRLNEALERKYHRYFSDVFLNHPSRKDGMRSLVYEEKGGAISGFLGVAPRRMRVQGDTAMAAISTQFMVDPESRGSLVGVHLMRTFLDGPQDISIADEANDVARRLWEGLGGSISAPFSSHWLRPLRPARLALLFAARRSRRRFLARAGSPLAPIVDGVAARLPYFGVPRPADTLSLREIDNDTLLKCILEATRRCAVWPDYDRTYLDWALTRARERKDTFGEVRQVGAFDANGKLVGWCVYCALRGGISEVLGFGARDNVAAALFDLICREARRAGAIALAGRSDQSLLGILSGSFCLFRPNAHWMLVHSRDPELKHTLMLGNASLSRLDGEFVLGLQ